MSAAGWVAFCLLLLVSEFNAPEVIRANRAVAPLIFALMVAVGAAILLLPWSRWGRTSLLWLVPVVFAIIGLNWHFGRQDGFVYAMAFLAVFLIVGMTQAPGTSLRLGPLLVLFYVVPLIDVSTQRAGTGMASAILVVPFCVATGELVAWGVSRIRQSEEHMADANERYLLSFEGAPTGMTQTSPSGTLVHVNPAFAELLGREVDELVGLSIKDITHPDDWEQNASSIRSLLDGEADRFTMEKRLIRADGTAVWVLLSVSLVRSKSGEPLYLFGHTEDISKQRALQDRLAHEAGHDQLTGLPNRAHFLKQLDRIVARSRQDDRCLALMFVDVDRFKMINDGLGHDAGDRVLQRVARQLQKTIRPGDLVGRFGGDEFTVLCEVASEMDASDIGYRLEVAVASATDSADDPYVSLSIGIAISDPREPLDSSLLIRRADAAMYQAKSGGKGRVVVFHQGDRLQSERRLQRSDELRQALNRGEMELFYQPIVELATGTMVGLEAQTRWRRPGGEVLSPEVFLPIAEESGLAVHLGNWALAEVCRQGSAWNRARSAHGQKADRLNLTINVSAQQMADPGFIEAFLAILRDTDFPPGQLWLEVTEGAVLEHRELVRDTAEHIRELGVHIGIDAFGSEHASFYYLKELRTELAKLDLRRIGRSDPEVEEGMLRGMLALADALGILCVATGVESARQATLLRSLGYRLAEGVQFGRALSTRQIGAFPTDDLLAWEKAAELTAV